MLLGTNKWAISAQLFWIKLDLTIFLFFLPYSNGECDDLCSFSAASSLFICRGGRFRGPTSAFRSGVWPRSSSWRFCSWSSSITRSSSRPAPSKNAPHVKTVYRYSQFYEECFGTYIENCKIKHKPLSRLRYLIPVKHLWLIICTNLCVFR